MLENDSDNSGVSAFVPHGQDIKASGTEVAYQPNPDGETLTMGEDSHHKVDGVGPTVSSVAITSDAGDDDTYGVGDAIQVTVTFSKSVTVTAGDSATSTPQLELDVGSTGGARTRPVVRRGRKHRAGGGIEDARSGARPHPR